MLGEYICSRCDYQGPKKKVKRGSAKMEMFCWAMFPVGPFYTAWRILTKRWGCPRCGETVMVPVRSKYDVLLTSKDDAEEDIIPLKAVPKLLPVAEKAEATKESSVPVMEEQKKPHKDEAIW